ncbi:MAG TPA: hypothetical protein V6C81_00200 [Planktothrix sp.]|jgi:hypothetical protein
MFAWKEKKNQTSQIRAIQAGEKQATTANRRAIGMLPSASVHGERQVFHCRDMKFHKLLLQIEARQSTCCLRIMSPSKKSRAAILVFRGRVLGCIYGNKRFAHQVFDYDALQYTLADMTAPDTMIEVYLLTQEIALAAASMFHSRLMGSTGKDDAYDLLQRAINGLTRTKSPGCVIINNCEGQSVCMVYMFGGKIVAIYSFLEGWLEPKFENAELCLSSVPDPQVLASALAVNSIEDALRLTLSLTGLTDHRPQQRSSFRFDFNPYDTQDKLPAFSIKRGAYLTTTAAG